MSFLRQPGMNGRELVCEIRRLHPGIRAIFMSGYSDRILSDSSALNSPASYLQKPFTLGQLAGVLRQADEASKSSQKFR